ncbi:uncharacterized protein LOC128991419 [Macrosteles quadrilineatus]|uniref:uncharacterized protein LOC128991419 n=1 Tax=Macrosteles quadrilineatus TaxID=74068 RepID=UPI0023E26493|nr:uncharacterized protein LOC128991419 [Macrosteles quadrilineatus]
MLRPILLIFCTFALCDAYVRFMISGYEMQKRIESHKSTLIELSKESFGNEFELVCYEEKWVKWRLLKWFPKRIKCSAFLEKLTYEVDGKKALVDWYLVDGCQKEASKTILQVTAPELNQIQVKYRTVGYNYMIEDKTQYYDRYSSQSSVDIKRSPT